MQKTKTTKKILLNFKLKTILKQIRNSLKSNK